MLQLGDRVSVTTPEGNNLVLKVVGIFSYGMAAFDDSKSYASIATVQKILMRDPSYITDLHIKLKDINEAKPLQTSFESNLMFMRKIGKQQIRHCLQVIRSAIQ